jgi:hypothetical protein
MIRHRDGLMCHKNNTFVLKPTYRHGTLCGRLYVRSALSKDHIYLILRSNWKNG